MKLLSLTGAAVAAAMLLSGAPARAAGPECTVQKFVDLPVTMVGTRPTVPAKINGHDVTFIADSGAFSSTLSNTAARELNLHLDVPPNNLHVFGVGGEADIMLARVANFNFAGLPLPNMIFVVSAGAGGEGYAGLLGQDIWGYFDTEYDLGGGAIRLFISHDCGDRHFAYWAGDKPYSVLSITYAEERNKKVFAEAFVNGQRLRVIFDTGASNSVMTLRAAERVGLKPDGPGVRRAGASGGLGARALRNWIGPVASFKIGDEEIKNTQLRFSEIELEHADMLLGADFFLSHRIFVANSQHRLYFTYNGGPVFNLDARGPVSEPAGPAAGGAPPPPSGDEPKTADAYSRRGAALAGRHDYERAIADYARAIELDPANAQYPYQRALARLALQQLQPAMADVEQSLKLKPDDVPALILRAELRMGDKDRRGAQADLDRAAELAAKTADVRLELASLYAQMNMIERALTQFDLWVAAHDDDSQMSSALAGRCRVRMLGSLEPDKALADCNRAIRLGPATATMYDFRAILEQRAGDLDRAIEDYNRVLTASPRAAMALYGRGLARIAKGQKADGDADIKAALAINPRAEETAQRLRIAPPKAGAPATTPRGDIR